MNYHVYMIETKNGGYYVGHTSNLIRRFERHLSKTGAKFTAQNVPIKVVWSQKLESELLAVKREKQIKGWRREKKENLIKGVWK